jgi:hypothetical protein
MFAPTPRHRVARAAAAAAPLVVALGLGAAPAVAGPVAPDVPSQLVPGGDVKPFLVGHAVGSQVHTCALGPTGYAWSFDGPTAALYGDNGQLLAAHSPGPAWTARDGSSVRAEVVDRAPVPDAIPWLLLRVTSRTHGADGDRLYDTTHIQRIGTTGGLTPPAVECSATSAGETRRVPYTADYVFWKAAGA